MTCGGPENSKTQTPAIGYNMSRPSWRLALGRWLVSLIGRPGVCTFVYRMWPRESSMEVVQDPATGPNIDDRERTRSWYCIIIRVPQGRLHYFVLLQGSLAEEHFVPLQRVIFPYFYDEAQLARRTLQKPSPMWRDRAPSGPRSPVRRFRLESAPRPINKRGSVLSFQ